MSGDDDGNTICVLIRYPRGQDGPFLLARDCPFVVIQRKKILLNIQSMLTKLDQSRYLSIGLDISYFFK